MYIRLKFEGPGNRHNNSFDFSKMIEIVDFEPFGGVWRICYETQECMYVMLFWIFDVIELKLTC